MILNIKEFLYAFSYDPRFFMNLPVLWAVTIDGVEADSINNVLANAGEKWRASDLATPRNMTGSKNLLVAQEVALPQETSSFAATETGGAMGGFLPGYGLTSRSNFLDRSFSINFLETTVDIEHNFFRPWAIAIGIKGLIESGPNLKATINVKCYSNQGIFLKGFKFNKVFPTAVEGYTMNYDSTDFRVKSVTFACENYEQMDYSLPNFLV
jgi:hypothetical protein